MHFSLGNCLLFIVAQPNQRVAQDPRIHCHMTLNPWAGVRACSAPRSHCGMPANAILSCTWLYTMHHTHQPYIQIWAHPLPNGHLVWQLEEGQPHLKPKKQIQ